MCSGAYILVQNTGSVNLTSMDFEYWVNSSPVKQNYSWTGNIAFMDTVTVYLPVAGLWQNGLMPSGNIFHAELVKANGAVDDYSYNNKYQSDFTLPGVVTSTFSVEFRTNNYPFDSNYQILDDNGNVVVTRTFSLSNVTHIDQYTLNGCYRLVVNDLGGDGLQWWANPNQGSGYVRLLNDQNQSIKSFGSDFGNFFEYSFSTDGPLKVKENTFGSMVNLYPNPSTQLFFIDGDDMQGSTVKVNDVLGHVVMDLKSEKKSLQVNTGGWAPGVYFVTVSKENNSLVRKIVVY